jgi:hypothetical protein
LTTASHREAADVDELKAALDQDAGLVRGLEALEDDVGRHEGNLARGGMAQCALKLSPRCTARGSFHAMSDTTPEAAALVRRAIERQSPAQRVEAALALSESLRATSLATLRARFPERSTLELVALMSGEPKGPTERAAP